MDCIIENCRADCLGCSRHWILDPVVEVDMPAASLPGPWVSAYLRRPKRTYKNYVAEKQLDKQMA